MPMPLLWYSWAGTFPSIPHLANPICMHQTWKFRWSLLRPPSPACPQGTFSYPKRFQCHASICGLLKHEQVDDMFENSPSWEYSRKFIVLSSGWLDFCVGIKSKEGEGYFSFCIDRISWIKLIPILKGFTWDNPPVDTEQQNHKSHLIRARCAIHCTPGSQSCMITRIFLLPGD